MRVTLPAVLLAAALCACASQPTDRIRFCNQAGPIAGAIMVVVNRARATQLAPGDVRASVTGIGEAVNEVSPLLQSIQATGYAEAMAALSALKKAAAEVPDAANPQQVTDALLAPLTDLQSAFGSMASAACSNR